MRPTNCEHARAIESTADPVSGGSTGIRPVGHTQSPNRPKHSRPPHIPSASIAVKRRQQRSDWNRRAQAHSHASARMHMASDEMLTEPMRPPAKRLNVANNNIVIACRTLTTHARHCTHIWQQLARSSFGKLDRGFCCDRARVLPPRGRAQSKVQCGGC